MELAPEKIIRKLIDIQDYITAKELSEMTGLSVSTVKQNMKEVKLDLEQYDLELVSQKGKGFYLSGTLRQKQRRLKILEEQAGQESESFFYRKIYILETLLEHYPRYTVQMFADDLSVSKHRILKDIEEIDQGLERFGLRLRLRRNSGAFIEGKEFRIRQVIQMNRRGKSSFKRKDKLPSDLDGRISASSYHSFLVYDSAANIKLIQTLICQEEKKLNIYYEDKAFCELIEYISLMSERNKKGIFVQPDEIGARNVLIEDVYINAAQNILKEFKYKGNGELQPEVAFLGAKLKTSEVCETFAKFYNKEYEEHSRNFVKRASELLEIPGLLWNEEVVRKIGFLLERMTVRDRYGFISLEESDVFIKEKNSGLYAICISNVDALEEKLNIHFLPDDIAHLTLLLQHAIKKISGRTEAVLVTAKSEEASYYMKEKIESEADNLDIKKIILWHRFEKEKYADSFILSTVRLGLTDDNYIEITPCISREDIKKINICIRKQSAEKTDSGLRGFLSEDFILLDENMKDKNEVIERGSQILQEYQFVDESYKEQVWQREKFRPTYIGKGIAIPHAFKEGVLKNGILVIRLKHPVEWAPKQNVKLILMLSVGFTEKEELRQFFKNLYEFIEDDERVEAVLRAQNKAELLKSLK